MNKAIEIFGNVVGEAVPSAPQRAFSLLNVGYHAYALAAEIIPPNKCIPPHLKYVTVINNRCILRALNHPERSAMVNLFFPCEVLHAMNIYPLFSEGMAGYLHGAGSEQAFIGYAENSGVPQTLCSYHKTFLGAALSNVLPAPRFVANTSLACDANLNTFRIIAYHYRVPHFEVDVPNVCTEETIHYVADQLKDLTCMVEEIMGAKMEEDHLREIIRSENRSLQMYHEHFRLLAGKFVPSIPGDEMVKIFPTHVLMGTPDAENYFKLLLEDTRAAAPSHGEKRILWAHTIPSSQGGIQQFLSFNDQRQLLACDINFDYLGEMDATQPYESMAKKLLLNLVNGSEENRAKGLLRMARYLRANGVVYFCHWGCKQTLGGARLISEYLEKEGFPVLILDGDSCDPKNVNEGQMNTRLQAFLEMLEAER